MYGDNYPDFINDKAGYGLAQWTYWSRKKALLEYAKAKGKSIGDMKNERKNNNTLAKAITKVIKPDKPLAIK